MSYTLKLIPVPPLQFSNEYYATISETFLNGNLLFLLLISTSSRFLFHRLCSSHVFPSLRFR